MVRLVDLSEAERTALLNLPCSTFSTTPWVEGLPLRERRVAVISTAGLHTRGDRRFGSDSADYRIIPGDVGANDLVTSHIAAEFDRTAFQDDVNVVLPLDRLCELATKDEIGSVADFHYSFMGATAPEAMAPAARHLAGLLKKDRVDAALLVPV